MSNCSQVRSPGSVSSEMLHHSQEQLSGLFHNKIHLLWNRPESLFLNK
ncbi:hypothetical protein [Microcoleus vaginatus]